MIGSAATDGGGWEGSAVVLVVVGARVEVVVSGLAVVAAVGFGWCSASRKFSLACNKSSSGVGLLGGLTVTTAGGLTDSLPCRLMSGDFKRWMRLSNGAACMEATLTSNRICMKTWRIVIQILTHHQWFASTTTLLDNIVQLIPIMPRCQSMQTKHVFVYDASVWWCDAFYTKANPLDAFVRQLDAFVRHVEQDLFADTTLQGHARKCILWVVMWPIGWPHPIAVRLLLYNWIEWMWKSFIDDPAHAEIETGANGEREFRVCECRKRSTNSLAGWRLCVRALRDVSASFMRISCSWFGWSCCSPSCADCG